MCQVAVTLTCATPSGHALIGRALYLPADWADDDERRELAGVPDEVMFATKPELAGHLLQHAHDRGIRAAFVAGDQVHGGLDLRHGIRERGTGYVMAVRSTHAVTLLSGCRLTVREAANLLAYAFLTVAAARQQARDGDAVILGLTPSPCLNCCGSSEGPPSPNPAATSPTATPGPYGDAATSTTPSNTTSAGTPTPTSCHSKNPGPRSCLE